MFERPTSVHCFSSTMTAESPVVGFEPVIRTSRRFDESGSLSSTRTPWSVRSASCRTCGHRAERVAPGRDLGRRRPVAELVEEAVGELVGEACLDRVRDELLGGALVEVH